MSQTQSVGNFTTQPYACNPQKVKTGIYGTAVTLVALAVIFGTLVLITERCALHLGFLNEPIQHIIQSLGQHTFVPFVISVSLLVVLVVGGIFCKKCQLNSKKFEKRQEEVPTLYNLEEQLINAARRGETENIRKALNEGIVTNPTAILEAAAAQGHTNLVQLLLDRRADPDPQTSNSDFSAIHYATRCWIDTNMALSTMKVLLEKDPTLANVKTKNNLLTPLHIAASSRIGGLEKVKLLIQCGAEINEKDSKGNTPLLRNVLPNSKPNIEIIEYLMKKGAQLTENNEGKTFAELAQTVHATWLNKPGIRERLKTCGIDIP